MLTLHYCTILAHRRRMEALEQKIWYYLNWETIIIWVCWVMRMRKAISEHNVKR